MHGRIFVLDTEEMKKRGEPYECPWEDYKLVRFIPGCDYVQQQEESVFESDCKWFAEVYGLKLGEDIKIQEVELDGEKFKVAKIKVSSLVEALRKNKRERLEEIKREMQKPNPDMWRIHYTAWTDSDFWFVYPDYGFGPEMKLLEWIERERPGKVYITKTYDYHC